MTQHRETQAGNRRRFWSVAEIAQQHGIPHAEVRGWIEAGRLAAVTLPDGRHLVGDGDLQAFLAQLDLGQPAFSADGSGLADPCSTDPTELKGRNAPNRVQKPLLSTAGAAQTAGGRR